jgi:hypothetical protein
MNMTGYRNSNALSSSKFLKSHRCLKITYEIIVVSSTFRPYCRSKVKISVVLIVYLRST